MAELDADAAGLGIKPADVFVVSTDLLAGCRPQEHGLYAPLEEARLLKAIRSLPNSM